MRNILLAVTAIALGSIPCNGEPPVPARDQKTVAKPVTAENYLDQFVAPVRITAASRDAFASPFARAIPGRHPP